MGLLQDSWCAADCCVGSEEDQVVYFYEVVEIVLEKRNAYTISNHNYSMF